jgi:hypothetical protein
MSLLGIQLVLLLHMCMRPQLNDRPKPCFECPWSCSRTSSRRLAVDENERNHDVTTSAWRRGEGRASNEGAYEQIRLSTFNQDTKHRPVHVVPHLAQSQRNYIYKADARGASLRTPLRHEPRGSQSLGLGAWWLHRYFHPRICNAPVRQKQRGSSVLQHVASGGGSGGILTCMSVPA